MCNISLIDLIPISLTATGESPITTKSVAERVRIVEQRQLEKQHQQPSPAGNGYSTKINVNLGAEEWTETGWYLVEEKR